MSDREELEALRRLAELEDKAAGRLSPLGDYSSGAISPEAGAMAREGMTPLDALLVGGGRFVSTLGAGIKQGVLNNYNIISPGSEKDAIKNLSDEQTANTQAYKSVQKEFPFSTSLGENLPYLGLGGGPFGLGLKSALIEGMKYGSPQQRGMGALSVGLTTGLGGAVSNTLGKYINPALSETQRGALSDMADFGIKPRLSQVTQSPTIERFEDWASRTPGGAGVMETFNRKNQDAANSIAAATIGQKANTLSQRVLNDASNDMGAVFDRIRALPPIIRLGQNVEAAADAVLKEQAKLGTMANADLVAVARQAKSAASQRGKIPGDTMQLWLTKLADKSSTAFSGGDATSGRGFNALKDALFDSGETSLRGAGQDGLADAFKTVRGQWGNFRTLTKGNVSKDGDVNPVLLAGALRTENPTGFRTGSLPGDLPRLGAIGEAFPPLRAGSQTYERQSVSDLPSTVARALFAYPTAKVTTSPMFTWLPSTLGGTPIGRLLEMLGVPGLRTSLAAGGQIPLQPFKPQE